MSYLQWKDFQAIFLEKSKDRLIQYTSKIGEGTGERSGGRHPNNDRCVHVDGLYFAWQSILINPM